ncbi:MAG: hypothetical protein HRT38_06460 [Alteromonadaceae bacterium]|nr:hypothetical protein [Alteromonadaceae bacterium]
MKIVILTCTLLLSSLAQAHFLWLEKTETNTVKLYFGEWQENRIENNDKLKKFSAAKIFVATAENKTPLTLHETFFSAPLATNNDVYMTLTSLPAKLNRAKKFTHTSYYAKVGRKKTTTTLSFELVPTVDNGNVFTLFLNDKPLEKTDIILYGPPKWQKNYRSNGKGQITIETPWPGQYIIKTSYQIVAKSGVATLAKPSQRFVFTNTFYVSDNAK